MEISLKYEGNAASSGELDLYDAARAMLGFQRTLALTTHFVLNGEIITQAPSLKGAEIRVSTPQRGSWEIVAMVGAAFVAGGGFGKDTVFGHLVWSIYDYVISNSLGFHVDFDKTLYRTHRDLLADRKKNQIQFASESSLDSLMEKTENAILDIHRPIVWSETATSARIRRGSEIARTREFNWETYEYASSVERAKKSENLTGYVSSYNINTYKGRIYVLSENRPVPFILAEHIRGRSTVDKITSSLRSNALESVLRKTSIHFEAFRDETIGGRLKSLYITQIY